MLDNETRVLDPSSSVNIWRSCVTYEIPGWRGRIILFDISHRLIFLTDSC